MGGKQPRSGKYIYLCIACIISSSLFHCATLKERRVHKMAEEHLSRGQDFISKREFDAAIDEFQKTLSLSPPKPLQEDAIFYMGLVYAHFANPKRNYEKSLQLFLKILNDPVPSPLFEQAKIWVGVISEHLETIKKIEKLKESIKEREDKREPPKEIPKEGVKAKPPEIRIEESKEGREHLLRSQKFLAQGNFEGAIGENQKVLALSDPKSQKDEALFNLGLIYAHFGNPQRDPKKSLECFKNLIKLYPKSTWVEQAKIWIGMLEENELLNQVIQRLKQVDIEIEEMRRKRAQ